MKRIVLLVLPVLVIAGLAFWFFKTGGDPDALHRHGIRGPVERTALPVPGARTSPAAYAAGGRNALALYVNDPSASWLGLVHGLKSAGVPVKVYADPAGALRHRVVFVYPSLTGANMTPDLRDRLEAHVARGGTLIACAVVGGGLRDVFGFREALETRGHMRLRLSAAGETGWRPEPEEIAVPLADSAADASAASSGLPGVEYREPVRPPLAVYGKGGAAIVGGPSGSGFAYAIGFDLGHFVLRAHGGRFNGKDRTYVNAFHPKVDGLMRMIRSWYVRGEPDAVTLRPAPDNRDFAALVTHDVDYTGSMNNVGIYSADEETRGIPATYFIQAKYVTDYNDRLFLDITRREELRRLAARGMEIASHSVAHSSVFRDMPLGTGGEAYPDYRPFVKTFTTQQGGTILGELRVSKYLLETLSGAHVTGFRPGHLSLPAALPQALAATGYRFSSSITAGQAMTHLPYRTMDDRSYDAESPVYEFPVTLEDEKWKLGERLDSALAVARAVGRHGGLVNVLIHTDEVGGKLDFERGFHAALKDEAWFGTLGSYGRWWAARDRILLDVESGNGGGKVLVVRSPATIEGLTLEIPESWRLDAGGGAQGDVAAATQSGNRLVLGALPAGSRTRYRFTVAD